MVKYMRERAEAARQPEILDVNTYGGLYGRFVLASQSQESEIANLINPAIKTNIDPSSLTLSETRDYNLITRGLSKNERVKAWEGIEYKLAYDLWRTKLTKSIKSTTDEKRIEAIKAISGKLASEFSEADTDNLYDTFCREKSDTTAFAKLIVSNLQKDGKVDLQKITSLSSDIEWISGSLFGKQTAVAVLRIVELEAEASNSGESLQKLAGDNGRMNDLTQAETEILASLYSGLTKEESEPEPKVAQSEALDQEPTAEEAQPTSSTPEQIGDPVVGQKYSLGNGKFLEIIGVIKRKYGHKIRVRKPDGNEEILNNQQLSEYPKIDDTSSQEPSNLNPTTTEETSTPTAEAEPDKPINEDFKKAPLAVGYKVQYQRSPYTITKIEGEKVFLSFPGGSTRMVDRKYLIEHLNEKDSSWKLIDDAGNIVTLAEVKPEELDDNDPVPPPEDT